MTKLYLDHNDIEVRMHDLAKRVNSFGIFSPNVYPIPRGGIPVAYRLQKYVSNMSIVNDPLDADIAIDDIIDSGRTAKHFGITYGLDTLALFDKQSVKDKDIGWVVFPWEVGLSGKDHSIEDAVIRMMEYIGEDTSREGLLETPKRVVKSWDKLFGGYKEDPKAVIKLFSSDGYDELVLLKNVEFYSTCEHHILPFSGKAHIAYIPNNKVIGISKLARLLEIFCRRMQIQERIGNQVTSILMQELNAKGAACILEAQHSCMTSRGVEKQKSIMVTSSLQGIFRGGDSANVAARMELMQLINN